MIKNFRHKGVERFFRTGSRAGIQPKHAARLCAQLAMLDVAIGPADMNGPGWKLHGLAGNLRGHWAVSVDKSWRLTFAFDGTDAILVDYHDYH